MDAREARRQRRAMQDLLRDAKKAQEKKAAKEVECVLVIISVPSIRLVDVTVAESTACSFRRGAETDGLPRGTAHAQPAQRGAGKCLDNAGTNMSAIK